MRPDERQQVLEQFAASELHLLRLIDGLSPEQLQFRTAPGRWSIGEIIEHVIAVEQRILRAIGKMTAQPSTRTERPDPTEKDQALWLGVTNRETRLEAPEPVHPAGKFLVVVEAVEQLRGTRARTLEFVSITDADLRGHVIPHIAFGELDLYQWLIVLSLHGSRHAAQIEEILADPAFPKS
ncbi:MAG TPA: DinB family protein [Bryobacteraceae bacterium]|nr:DinB family protein [Bryobacteraceae bacterium]